jgi:hypothetical protein
MKSRSTKTARATTRENLEEKFDAGQDVSDYFDFSRAMAWGGKRQGSGRKPLGKVRKQVLLSSAVIAKIDALAKKKHLSFSAAVEDVCATLP